MKIFKIYLVFFSYLFVLNCTKQEKVSLIEEKDLELQMIDAFREGYRVRVR